MSMPMSIDMFRVIAVARWSIGIDWEISGPMKIINMVNRLIQLPRASPGD
jgi:hypothetical protein